MKLVDSAIHNPTKAIVAVILVVLFGLISLYRLPVQLTPQVQRPVITIRTLWAGASPQEVEREIIYEQEEQLKSLEGLMKMTSESTDGRGEIELEFALGTDMQAALLKVGNRLDQVREYPEDADKPFIATTGGNDAPIAWFVLHDRSGQNRDVTRFKLFAEDYVKARFERVPGVALSNVHGGRDPELQVIVDPEQLAAYRLTILDVRRALVAQNQDISGGDFDEGKRRYVVRTLGQFGRPEQVEKVVIAQRGGAPIYVKDVADVRLDYEKRVAVVRHKDREALVLNALRDVDANVLQVMSGLREAVRELNQGILRDKGLRLVQVYDETDYITSAIGLVRQNIVVGGLLAVSVMLVFLRSARSTLVIATAIPISVIGTFIMLGLFGRTLNVISLAGMAFAVGMVVDSAIVVLENIYRHRQLGKPAMQAAYDGAVEVWGAVLASALTTMAVFIPVFFVQQEAGQLFRDIAVAISCAVGLALIVSVTVIPVMASRILQRVAVSREAAGRSEPTHGHDHNLLTELFGLVPLARGLTEGVVRLVHWLCGGTLRRIAVAIALTGAAACLSWRLMPEREYLPHGNRNLVFAGVIPPPGLNLEALQRMGDHIRNQLRPYWEAKPGTPEAAQLKGPPLEHFFFVAWGRRVFMGAAAAEPRRAGELVPVMLRVLTQLPGVYPFVQQSSLFERGLTAGRTIEIEITGPDINKLVALGQEVFVGCRQALPDAQVQPNSDLELASPELHVVAKLDRAATVGLTTAELGYAVNALVDGAYATTYWHEGKEIDLVIKGKGAYVRRTQDLERLYLCTPKGAYVPLSSVAEVREVVGLQRVTRVEHQRAAVILVKPSEQMTLENAMSIVREKVLGPLQKRGEFGTLYKYALSGTADKLQEAWGALAMNFALALAITYLLMAALFESFLYPFVIMFSVPLAAVGGFAGLAIVHGITGQKLDILTMLGFVILIGTVVNNAILIVHQALNNVRQESMPIRDAITESVRTRVRPIFMSTLTSVCGMMPLVLFPGAGSELYRGLGSVVVGGLLVSTVFTLFLVPTLFSLTWDMREGIRGWRRRTSESPPEPVPLTTEPPRPESTPAPAQSGPASPAHGG